MKNGGTMCVLKLSRRLFFSMLTSLELITTIAACASPSSSGAFPFQPSNGNIILGSIPFFPTEGGYCEPVALASFLQFYDLKVTPEEVEATVYRQEIGGTLPLDLVRYARKKDSWPTGSLGTAEKLSRL
ncbi:MAG: hypothetical protein HQK55_00160 [Deltaproteobacteria bacterium]|nr:hypothetical protein [Deltaproteobacteria bacterium]